jgi:hypothetical protein
MSKEAPMTPREAMETVLEAAEHRADILSPQNEKKDEIREAIHLMEVYMNAKGMRGYKKVI